MRDYEVIILAAGQASRFGSAKQLAIWRGKPLLQYAIENARCLGKKPWLALGAFRDEIIANPSLDLSSCHIVSVDNWAKGVSESIRQCVLAIQSEAPLTEGVLLLLGDQPLISLNALEQMLERLSVADQALPLLAAAYEEGPGVPAFIPARFFPALLALGGDQGARFFLRQQKAEMVSFDGLLADIDVFADLADLSPKDGSAIETG